MAGGFEVYKNDGGKVQIRDDAIAYTLVSKGTLSDSMFSNEDTGMGIISSCEVDIYNAVAPVIAFRSNSDNTRVAGRTMWSSEKGRFVVVFNKWYNLSAQGVEYFIFDSVRQSGGNYGIQMMDENGGITFDSSWKLMDIIQVISLPPRSHDVQSIVSNGLTFDTSHEPGSFAVCIAAPRAAAMGQDLNQNSILMDCAWIVGSRIRVSLVTVRAPGAISTTGWCSNNGLSIILVNTKGL